MKYLCNYICNFYNTKCYYKKSFLALFFDEIAYQSYIFLEILKNHNRGKFKQDS